MSPYRIERKRRLDAAVLAPKAEDHPCKNGHNYQNVGGYIQCTRCGTVLGKA